MKSSARFGAAGSQDSLLKWHCLCCCC